MDSSGRLFVADRGNNRIEIFDQNGNFIEEWKQFGRPMAIFIDAGDTIYVADHASSATLNPGVRRGIRIGSVKDGVVRKMIPASGLNRTRRTCPKASRSIPTEIYTARRWRSGT